MSFGSRAASHHSPAICAVFQRTTPSHALTQYTSAPMNATPSGSSPRPIACEPPHAPARAVAPAPAPSLPRTARRMGSVRGAEGAPTVAVSDGGAPPTRILTKPARLYSESHTSLLRESTAMHVVHASARSSRASIARTQAACASARSGSSACTRSVELSLTSSTRLKRGPPPRPDEAARRHAAAASLSALQLAAAAPASASVSADTIRAPSPAASTSESDALPTPPPITIAARTCPPRAAAPRAHRAVWRLLQLASAALAIAALPTQSNARVQHCFLQGNSW